MATREKKLSEEKMAELQVQSSQPSLLAIYFLSPGSFLQHGQEQEWSAEHGGAGERVQLDGHHRQ